jgi:alpha-glucosidase
MLKSASTRIAVSISLAMMMLCVTAGTAAVNAPPSQHPWWQKTVFYEIYPRSFADAKNTGMGNIAGITSKLDYLKQLGAGALWITPCYPSPQVDFGYDISDYTAIAPEYGTMQDFDKLMAESKKRDIKIVMDLVMNHTSDQHPWFRESRSSKTNPKRDWYVWRDPKPDGSPPNNWQSLFGHSAWTLDPKTNQYFYHFFYPEQPDLNWRNPEVKKAMFDAARFWLDKGVAGFRLDAICTLFEDPELTNNPVKAGATNKYGDAEMIDKYNHMACQSELHQALRDFRAMMDSYPGDRVIIGETVGEKVEDLSAMYGQHLDEIQLPMNFFFTDVNKLSAMEFRKQIEAWDKNPEGGWPVYLFSNHDQVRHYDRYGDGKHNDDIAKLTATMLMTLRGTPILYYGEEIGMTNNDPKRVEDVKDPIGKIGWPKEKGRDGERTPMQWSAAKNAGFSDAKPWLPVAGNYKTHNVAAEEANPNSILNFYKTLTHLRKTNDALASGGYVSLNRTDPNVLAYLRNGTRSTVVVALNMTDKPQPFKFDASQFGITDSTAMTIASNPKVAVHANLANMTLPPFGVYVGELPQVH